MRFAAPFAVTTCSAALLLAVGSPNASAAVVTPSYVTTINASDTMSRTVTGGLGTADLGGSYTTSPASTFSVSGGAGHVASIPAGQSVRATLSGVSAADEQVQSTFSLPSLPVSGNGVYYQLEFRRQANGDAYRVRVRVAPGGTMTLSFTQIRNNAQTAIGLQVVAPQRATAGGTIAFQGFAAGSSTVELRARAWLYGTAAPDWQLAAADSASSRLTAAGQIGLFAYTSSASTAAQLTLSGLTGWQVVVKPGPTNTGVPAGTVLTQYYGDLVVTTPGATYDALDIHGFVTIKAANVTIKRSIIRGAAATGFGGVVTDTNVAGTNFVLQDSEVVPAYPSVYLDGVIGWNYTLTRVNIHGTVDSAKVFGSNATIQNSWLHDEVYYLKDPNQGGGPSHNDGVQVLSGSNIRILNNTMTGGDNSAVQVTQGNGVVSDLWLNGNWADGGGCTMNINNTPLASMAAVTANDNRFGHATRIANCPIISSRGTALSANRNVYDDTGYPAIVRDGG